MKFICSNKVSIEFPTKYYKKSKLITNLHEETNTNEFELNFSYKACKLLLKLLAFENQNKHTKSWPIISRYTMDIVVETVNLMHYLMFDLDDREFVRLHGYIFNLCVDFKALFYLKHGMPIKVKTNDTNNGVLMECNTGRKYIKNIDNDKFIRKLAKIFGVKVTNSIYIKELNNFGSALICGGTKYNFDSSSRPAIFTRDALRHLINSNENRSRSWTLELLLWMLCLNPDYTDYFSSHEVKILMNSQYFCQHCTDLVLWNASYNNIIEKMIENGNLECLIKVGNKLSSKELKELFEVVINQENFSGIRSILKHPEIFDCTHENLLHLMEVSNNMTLVSRIELMKILKE